MWLKRRRQHNEPTPIPAEQAPQLEQEPESFTGGVLELGTVETSRDAHEAVGRWWARAILRAGFDNGATDGPNLFARKLAREGAAEGRSDIELSVAGFAKALAHLSRTNDLVYVRVDYHPDPVLMEAAELAEMPASDMFTFPWKTSTVIRNDIVIAHDGYNGPGQQIWPPVES